MTSPTLARSATRNEYDAVLLVGFGGPEGPGEVMPFLRAVTRGRGIPDERLEVVASHYRSFGGVSPVNAQNRMLRQALEVELESRGMHLPVYWGNRNAAPFLHDTIRAAADAGRERFIAVVTSAYSSYSGCRQYREDIAGALSGSSSLENVRIDTVRPYFDHPGFVVPFIENLRETLRWTATEGIPRARTHILFTTHSIPLADAAASGPAERDFGPGGAYAAQHIAVAEVIRHRAGASAIEWSLAYQSRSGSPRSPWLEPDVNVAIENVAGNGTEAVVIVPIGFVSDHMEVVWDLDVEAMETARRCGILAVRVPTPGVHPAFVAGLADLVVERATDADRKQRPALTHLGPWSDVCSPDCCTRALHRG